MGRLNELGELNQAAQAAGAPTFGQVLDQAVRAVDQAQVSAEAGLRGVATGNDVDIHGAMIALEEANISLKAMVSVRDKLVDAYREVWAMQI